MCDDGAPYCGIDLKEFKLIQPHVLRDYNACFEDLPDTIKPRTYWQYGSGKHKSESRRILGSIFLSLLTDQGNLVNMRHLAVEGSSQWMIGRNVTKSCDILHIGRNVLKLPNGDTISLIDQDLYSFIPYDSFCINGKPDIGERGKCTMFCAAGMLNSSTDNMP